MFKQPSLLPPRRTAQTSLDEVSDSREYVHTENTDDKEQLSCHRRGREESVSLKMPMSDNGASSMAASHPEARGTEFG